MRNMQSIYSPAVSEKRMNQLKSLWITIFLFALFSPANAIVIHVPSDQLTIQDGIDSAGYGDTILVANGHYYETIDFSGKNIILLSENGPGVTVIDGEGGDTTMVVNMSSWGLSADCEINGFTVKNGQFGVHSSSDHDNPKLVIKNCIITNNGTGISGHFKQSWEISNSVIINNDYGFTKGYYGDNSYIINCIFDQNIEWDIQFVPSYGTDVELDIVNSIVTGEIRGWTNPIKISYSDLLTVTDSDSMITLGEGVIHDNPLFGSNYHLSTTSPCLNAGDPDLNGNGVLWNNDEDDQNPDGTRMDMGAYYLHHTTVSLPNTELIAGDTTLIPLMVDFNPDSSYSSAAIYIGGYLGHIELLGIEISSTLTGDASWTYQYNENDTLAIIWSAGSTNISGNGILFYLKFYASDSATGIVPMTIVSAQFNEGYYPTIINSGITSIYTIAFGDVSQNGEISPYDASLVLKYLVGVEALNVHQQLNADVSLDSTISALDASIILQYGVGLIDTLPYNTTMGSLLASGEIVMQDVTFEPGAIVEVPIFLSNGDNILSFETEIGFDADALTYYDVVWSDDLGEFAIESNIIDGQILFAGAGTIPDGQENIFATLRFTVNESFNGYETTVFINNLRFNEGEFIENSAFSTLTMVLSIEDDLFPAVFALHQNTPNPWNPITTLRYDLPEPAQVSLVIYDLLGREVRALVTRFEDAGYRSVIWDGTNNKGEHVAAGVYLFRIQAGNHFQTKKMLLLK